MFPSEKEFLLGNKADELLKLTLEMCGKDESKTLRFPKVYYESYVSQIIGAAAVINRNIIMANEMERGEERTNLQKEAKRYCVWLNHLIRICADFGWISIKQRDRWQKLATGIKWGLMNWIKSDEKIKTGIS